MDLRCNTDGATDRTNHLRLIPTIYGYARKQPLVPLYPDGSFFLRRIEGPFHIRKIVKETESSHLTKQKQHRYTLRLDNRTKSRMTSADHLDASSSDISWRASSSSQHWNEQIKAFHSVTEMSSFDAQITLQFFAKSGPITSSNWFTLFIEVGLERDKAAGQASETRALKPWAAVCQLEGNSTFDRELSNSRWFYDRDDNVKFKKYVDGPVPTSLMVKDASEGRSRISCSVSTNVNMGRESGIYEVVLLVEEEVSHAWRTWIVFDQFWISG